MLMIGCRPGEGFTAGEHIHVVVTHVATPEVTVHITHSERGQRTLTITEGARIKLGADIIIFFQKVQTTWVRIGIDAPPSVHITRDDARRPQDAPTSPAAPPPNATPGTQPHQLL